MEQKPHTAVDLVKRAKRLWREKNDPVQALGLLTHYLDNFSEPQDVARLLIAIGNFHKDTGAYDMALDSYRKALSLHPVRTKTTIAAANILIGRGDIEESEKFLKEFLQQHPDNPLFLEVMMNFCINCQRYEEAEAYKNHLARVAVDPPANDEKDRGFSIVRHAYRLRKEKNSPEEALKFLLDRIDSFGTPRVRASIYTGIGDCHKTLGNRPEALCAYKKAMDLDPKFPLPLVSSASILISLRSFSEAQEYLNRAIKLKPGDPCIPILQQKINASRFAEVTLQSSVRKAPVSSFSTAAPPINPPAPQPPLSVEETMRQRITRNPRDIGAMNSLADILLRRKEPAEAAVLLRAILMVDKLNADAKKKLRELDAHVSEKPAAPVKLVAVSDTLLPLPVAKAQTQIEPQDYGSDEITVVVRVDGQLYQQFRFHSPVQEGEDLSDKDLLCRTFAEALARLTNEAAPATGNNFTPPHTSGAPARIPGSG